MGISMGKEVEMEERGRILVPKGLREEFNLKPGQKLLVEKRGKEIIIKPSINAKKY